MPATIRSRLFLLRAVCRWGFVSCLALSLAIGLAACAVEPPADDPEAVAEFKELDDPLEPTNRVFYVVYDRFDTYVLEPLARTYRKVVPDPVRTGLTNTLSNLNTPVRLGNDILEGKPRRAGDTTMRFLINSTVGVLGVFDVATGLGYPKHDNSFGLTLANWGVPDGPYLFLPIVGPSSPRDLTGFAVDTVGDPFYWIGQGAVVKALDWTRFYVESVNSREKALDPIQSIKRTALDPYATFRSLYRQYRASQLTKLREDNRATVPVWFPQMAGQEINPAPR